MADFSRRQFLVGCSAAIAAMAGSRLTSVVMGDPLAEPDQEIMLTIFIRGGWDALNIMPPFDGADRGFYEAARSTIQVPADSTYQLGTNNFFFHPSAARLHELYNAGYLAAVQATGILNLTNRSHFDSMSFMELGTPGSKVGTSGWLARHLESANIFAGPEEQASLATGNLSPTSLLSYLDTLTIANPNNFTLNIGPSAWRTEQRQALTSIYGGESQVEVTGSNAIASLDIVANNLLGSYTPEPGVNYPGGGFGRDLQTIARLIKAQVGLRSATLDFGGWDTHNNQGPGGGGYFANHLQTFSEGIYALFNDLNTSTTDYRQRFTMAIMSEFGRTFNENDSLGTDHGKGNAMFVLGGCVNGGQLYGSWPGLSGEQLHQGREVDVMTDYRQVLSEILIRRFANPNLSTVFPGYSGYTPLGVVMGDDITPT
ncbi:MAG TPA: DUF1501 domain-containing protein [Thermodesulfobacteriota bacterium]|nr:DUF1501 domain-containing protein [Thermodesulfobacteriota bacterium]